jgi:hypothetical protein
VTTPDIDSRTRVTTHYIRSNVHLRRPIEALVSTRAPRDFSSRAVLHFHLLYRWHTYNGKRSVGKLGHGQNGKGFRTKEFRAKCIQLSASSRKRLEPRRPTSECGAFDSSTTASSRQQGRQLEPQRASSSTTGSCTMTGSLIF